MDRRFRQIRDLQGLLDLLGGAEGLSHLQQAENLKLAFGLVAALRLTEKLYTDQEMISEFFGVGRKTFLRRLRADPGAHECAVYFSVPGKRKSLRRWKAWELIARWSGPPRGRGAA